MYAYGHTPLDEETIKLTGISPGDKLYAFIRGFYELKGLSNFFYKTNVNSLSITYRQTFCASIY